MPQIYYKFRNLQQIFELDLRMSEQKNLRWLYSELPTLVEKGVITKDIATKLEEYYGTPEEESKYGLGLIIVGVLGTLLIGGGIILIFAYNWESMPKTWRTFFSYLPLLLAQAIYTYVFFKKKSKPAWVEASSAFLMLMLAASIALISQTYHIGGSLKDFLFSWMGLSIPLLYLMNSRIVGIIYLMGITSFVFNSNYEQHWYWGFLLVAVPYFYTQVWKNKSSNASLWLMWGLAGSFLVAYWGVINMNVAEYSLLGTALILSIYYLLGNKHYENTKNILRIPLQTIAGIGIFILAMILTYSWPIDAYSWDRILSMEKDGFRGILNLIILLGLVLTYVGLLYFHKRKQNGLSYLLIFFPLVLLIGLVISRMGYPIAAKIFANIFLFIWGLTYLKTGVEHKNMTVINQGIGIIGILIIARFFDTNWSIIIKGVVFVILGLGFLVSNFFLSRKMKN